MAALDFPTAPTVDQLYPDPSIPGVPQYKWDGATWSTVSVAVSAASGGTGQTSYTVGDLLYASAATVLSKRAAVATGNALISGGVATAPSWGKINLAAAGHVSGTLPIGNGGNGTTTGVSSATQTAINALIPAGSVMLFMQSAAPTGWTKQTALNDYALRLVSGSGGGGGGVYPFSTIFGRYSTDAMTLTTAHVPAHQHVFPHYLVTPGTGAGANGGDWVIGYGNAWSNTDGGSGGAHQHGNEMRTYYVDVIGASKN